MPNFPLGGVAGQHPQGNLEYLTVNSSFRSAGSTSRRDQARSEMQLLHLGLGRHLGGFPVGLASRACLTSLPLGILDTWPN